MTTTHTQQTLAIECLGCGQLRLAPADDPRSCPRCNYVGWAASHDLDERDRAEFRLVPLEFRRPGRLDELLAS
jgi:hypothetical protein